MKSLITIAFVMCPFFVNCMEYSKLIENDRVIVSKWILDSGEEAGLHTNPYPRVVISSKGGVVTRIEADGTTININFPAGTPVYLEADPVGELHNGANLTDAPVEAFMVEIKT